MASAKQIAWRKKFARMSKAGKFRKAKKSTKSKTKYPTIKMPKTKFYKKVDNGQIMIGGLGNPDGVRIMKETKDTVWYKK